MRFAAFWYFAKLVFLVPSFILLSVEQAVEQVVTFPTSLGIIDISFPHITHSVETLTTLASAAQAREHVDTDARDRCDGGLENLVQQTGHDTYITRLSEYLVRFVIS